VRTGQTVDLAEWASLLALDFMGDFAYSGAFNTMKAGADLAGVRKIGEHGVMALEILGTIPWIRPITLAFPQKQAKKMLSTSLAFAERRKAQGASVRDLFYYLVCSPLALFVPADAHAAG
jgi:hypothetical protein